MFAEIALFPQEASTTAGQVDLLFLFLLAICGAVTLLVACLLVYFAVRYRRRPGEVGNPAETHSSERLEWFWTLTPLAIFMAMFVWGAEVYFGAYRPPDDAATIYVVGKQWMWKFQHPEGQREINALHVPVGRPVRLLMTSEDVIHSLFIPDFRIHMDLLPERYTSVWFQASRLGTYRLFCSQYCGTNHAGHDGAGDVPWSRPTTSSGCSWGPKARWPWKDGRCFSSTAAPVVTVRMRTPGAGTGGAFRQTGRPERWPRGRGRRGLHPRVDPLLPARRSWPVTRTSCRLSKARSSEEEIFELIAFIQSLETGQNARASGELSAARDYAAHQQQG